MIKPMEAVHICFDFDGTLADSFEGIYWAFCESAHQHKLNLPQKSELRRIIGPPVEKLFDQIYGASKEYLRESFRIDFRKHYDQEGYRQTSWYDGAEEQIIKLRDAGATLSIVTNKPTRPTTKLVEKKKLSKEFELIIGIDYLVNNKSKQKFSSKKEALDLLKISIGHVKIKNLIYVGDTPGDLQAAHASQFVFVACTYGYHDWSQETKHDRIHLLDNINNLHHLCSSLVEGDAYGT